jgi:hypothetical protein
LAITSTERKTRAINKSTFWYQKKKHADEKKIRLYHKLIDKLAFRAVSKEDKRVAHCDADNQSKQQYTGIKAQHDDNAAFFSPTNDICDIF